MNRIFLFTLICLLPLPVSAQIDTLFWFAAPDVFQTPQNFDRPIRLGISTYGQASTVTISQPAGGGMPVQTVTIPANSTQTVDLTAWISVIETAPANTVRNHGLKIHATTPVSVYYEIVSQGPSPEAFVLKGTNALGTDFWIPSQNLVDNSADAYYSGSFASFEIVATENNTAVTITPSRAIVGRPAGVPFTITLNEGQTYAAVATSKAVAQHLYGSRITADKSVAVTIKDDQADGRPNNLYGPCADLIGDQIVPVHMLGTEYIAIKGLLNPPGDYLFILATQNGTSIAQDGSPVATINAGQTYQLPVGAGASTYIQTSRPAYVSQLTGTGCEMGFGVLPHIHCTGSTAVSYKRIWGNTLYLNVLVHAGGQGDFRVNSLTGVINASDFAAVPGTSGQWYAARVLLPVAQFPQGGVISVTNSSTWFHLGVLDGSGPGVTYGYFSDFNSVSLTARTTAPQFCEGDQIALLADSITGATYTWTASTGFGSNQRNPVIAHAAAADSGIYTVTANINGCTIADTVVVPVFPLPAVSLGPDIVNCADSVLLQSSPVYPGASYRWSSGAVSQTLAATQSGVYWLEITENGCTGSDTVNVMLNPDLTVNLGPDTAFCAGDTLTLTSVQPSGTQYLWSTGLTGQQAEVWQSGTYWLYVNRNGCTGSDTIHVQVTTPPVVDIGNDTVICASMPAAIGTALRGATYLWNTGATAPYTEVSATGDYILAVNLEGCIVRDTIRVTAMPDPDVDLGPDSDICPEQVIMLDATHTGNNRYLWNTGDTTAVIAAHSGGVYDVTVISEYGCTGSDTIMLNYYPGPVVLLGPDTTVCEETPLLLVAGQINADSLRWSEGTAGSMLTVRYGGEYIVTGMNKCGVGSDTIVVKQIFCEIWVPNAFTPNGDGINDVFRILGNTGRMQGVRFGVFNRWGEQLFHTQDKYQGWDGTYKGAPALLGTYVYLLEYSIDGKPYLERGNFHLLR